jgi:hypothetical protein
MLSGILLGIRTRKFQRSNWLALLLRTGAVTPDLRSRRTFEGTSYAG